MMPSDEVALQKRYNEFHTNGRRLLYSEQACAFARHWAEFPGKLLPKPASILDVGSRLGYTCAEFEKLFPEARVVGVDLVPDFVEMSKADYGIEAYEASADDLPFDNEEFDWVFCCQVLEHVPDMPKAIDELFRVAHHSIYISIPLEPDTPYSREINPSHHHFIPDPIDWIALFKRPTWSLVEARDYGNNYFNFCLVRRSCATT